MRYGYQSLTMKCWHWCTDTGEVRSWSQQGKCYFYKHINSYTELRTWQSNYLHIKNMPISVLNLSRLPWHCIYGNIKMMIQLGHLVWWLGRIIRCWNIFPNELRPYSRQCTNIFLILVLWKVTRQRLIYPINCIICRLIVWFKHIYLCTIREQFT